MARWLGQQPVAADAGALQAQLDRYREAYNHRGHQVHAGKTPQQRFEAGPLAGPDPTRGQPHTVTTHTVTTHTVTARGVIGVNGALIGLGRSHAGATATVFRTGNDLAVFINNTLLGQLTIDRTRRYQRLPQLP